MAKSNLLNNILEASTKDSKFEEEDKILAPLLNEINLIMDNDVKMFVRRLLLAAPAGFWTAPSDVGNEIYPHDESVAGGLVLHTRRVVRCSWLLAESQGRGMPEMDILIAASLIHDIFKSDDAGNVDPLHAYVIDPMIEEIAIMDHIEAENETEVDRSTINGVYERPEVFMLITRLVRCHRGLLSVVPETFPVTTVEWLFAFANDVAKNLELLMKGPEIYVSEIEVNTSEAEVVEG